MGAAGSNALTSTVRSSSVGGGCGVLEPVGDPFPGRFGDAEHGGKVAVEVDEQGVARCGEGEGGGDGRGAGAAFGCPQHGERGRRGR